MSLQTIKKGIRRNWRGKFGVNWSWSRTWVTHILMGTDHWLTAVDFAQCLPCCHIYLLKYTHRHPKSHLSFYFVTLCSLMSCSNCESWASDPANGPKTKWVASVHYGPGPRATRASSAGHTKIYPLNTESHESCMLFFCFHVKIVMHITSL